VINPVEISPAYITEKEFREYPHELDLTSYTGPQLETLLNLAGYWVQEYVDLPFIVQTCVDERVGNNKDTFTLTAPPKTLISVKEYNSDNSYDVIANSEFILLPTRAIRRKSSYFFSEYLYKVSYRSGEQKIPTKARTAVYLCLIDFLNSKDFSTMKSIKIDTILINFRTRTGPIPKDAEYLLGEWKIKSKII